LFKILIMPKEKSTNWSRNGIPEGYVSLRSIARDNKISSHRMTRELNALPDNNAVHSIRIGRVIAVPTSEVEKIIELCKNNPNET